MRKNKNNDKITKLVIIYFVCLLFISTAYSFFNVNLELKGKAGFSVDAIRQFSYDYDLTGSWRQGQTYYYQFTINFRYTGFENINGWQANINVPMDTEITGCFDATSCTVVDSMLRITNAAYNGTVNPQNQMFSTSFIMKTSNRKYELSVHSVNFYQNGEITNPIIPDTPDVPDPTDPTEPPDIPDPGPQIITGITANLTNSGSWGNTTQFSLTIDNKSDIDLYSWELRYTIPSGTTMTNIWGADYVITDDTLILTGLEWSSEINSGASMSQIGFQVSSSTTPANLILKSFTGVNSDQEDVEMQI